MNNIQLSNPQNTDELLNVLSQHQDCLFLILKYLTIFPKLKDHIIEISNILNNDKLLPTLGNWNKESQDKNINNNFNNLLKKYEHLPADLLFTLIKNKPPNASNNYEVLGFGRHGIIPLFNNFNPFNTNSIFKQSMLRELPKFKNLNYNEPFYNLSNPYYYQKNIIASYKQISSSIGHLAPVYCTLIDHTSSRLFTGSDDHVIKIWHLHTGRLLKSLRGHVAEITDLALSPDNQILVSSSHDTNIRVWSLPSGNPIAVLRGHTKEVLRVLFVEIWSIPRLISASMDGSMRIWDVVSFFTPREIIAIDHIPNKRNLTTCEGVECLWIVINPSCTEVALCFNSGKVRIHRLNDLALLAEESLHTSDVSRAVYSTKQIPIDSSSTPGYFNYYLLTSSSDGSAVISKRIGSHLQIVSRFWFYNKVGKATNINFSLWSHDEEKIILSGSRYVNIYSVKDGTNLFRLEHHNDIQILHIHPLWDLIVSGGADGLVHLTELETGKSLQSIQIQNQFTDAAFSQDGTYLAFATDVGKIIIMKQSHTDIYQNYDDVPESQFFLSDYNEIRFDAYANAIDVPTQSLLHLLPPSPLVDIGGTPHIIQPSPITFSERISTFNTPEFITKQLALTNLANSFVENKNSYHENHYYDYKAAKKASLTKESPARKKPKNTVAADIEDNSYLLDTSIVISDNESLASRYSVNNDSGSNRDNLNVNSDNPDLSSDSDSASDLDDDNSSYNDYKYEPRTTRRSKLSLNPIKKMREERDRRRKDRSRVNERMKVEHKSENESSRQSSPEPEVWETEQWVAKPQSTPSNFNWLECTKCSTFSYIPQVEDQVVLYFEGFYEADNKQAVKFIKNYPNRKCLFLEITALTYSHDRFTKIPSCKIEFKIIDKPQESFDQSSLISTRNSTRKALTEDTIDPEFLSPILNYKPHDYADYLVLISRVTDSLSNDSFCPFSLFFTSFADSEEIYKGEIMKIRSSDIESAWNSVEVKWDENDDIEDLSPWDLEYENCPLAEEYIKDDDCKNCIEFLEMIIPSFKQFEDLSLLSADYKISLSLILNRLEGKNYYRSIHSFLRDISQIRINVENFYSKENDNLIVLESMKLEEACYNKFSTNPFPPSGNLSFLSKNNDMFYNWYDSKTNRFWVLQIDEDAMIVRVTKRMMIPKKMIDLNIQYSVESMSRPIVEPGALYEVLHISNEDETIRIRRIESFYFNVPNKIRIKRLISNELFLNNETIENLFSDESNVFNVIKIRKPKVIVDSD